MPIQLKKNHDRYAKYKDTEIAWPSTIPNSWCWQRLRFSTQLNPSKSMITWLDENLPVSFIPMEAVSEDGVMHKGEVRPMKEVKEGYTFFQEHDVLMAKITPCFENGKGAVAKKLHNNIGFGSTEFLVLRSNKKILPRLLWYFISSHWFRHTGEVEMRGSAGQKRVPERFVKDFFVGFPSIFEQDSIVRFLDEKSALIEKIIQAKQKQIELLKEKRSALINRAVTKGIRTKVMFDTNAFDRWQKLSKKEHDQLLERVEIIYTHIQEDELPSSLRCTLSAGNKVLTSGAIWDVSKWDNCTWGSEDDGVNINTVVGNGKKENHNKDALIANTAKMQNYLLITDDQRLQKKSSQIGCKVISFQKFLERFEMKDSGVEWIGTVPRQWIIEKLKFLAPVRNKKIANASPKLQYIALENVESWTGKLINLDEKTKFESVVNRFEEGDVLFGKLRPYLAKVVSTKFNGVCTGEMLVLHPNRSRVLKEFLFYRLISTAFIDIVNYSTYGTKMPRAGWSFIGNLMIALPKLEEQKKIVSRLETQLERIGITLEKNQQSISLLREYKTSLISNVVTGKIKVIN